MPKSRRRKKKTSRPGSDQQSYQPPAQPVVRPALEPPTPDPPPVSDRERRARLDALLRGPGADPDTWSAEVAALLAEFESRRQYRTHEPPNYDHLPPLEKLVHPKYSPETTQHNGSWPIAVQRATDAYLEIRDEAERLGPRLRHGPTGRYGLSTLNVDPRDTYFATKSVAVDIGDAEDLYRYAKGNLEALQRAERLMASRARPTKWVTPGYRWLMDRTAADTGRRETVEITLTVNAEGLAQLRCGDHLAPATPQAWADLTADALPSPLAPKRPPREPTTAPPPVRRTPSIRQVLAAVVRALFSQDFWLAFLLLALVVAIAVVMVMAITKL
ncbi:hypothetical protein ACFCV3_06120 [Kribbella sp. NPDC056345]|uniref:hypothetical protein n=1 Tax=Kribbella sp. NPDC056345 TaxID=3345789 RepID=UPI0035DDC96B